MMKRLHVATSPLTNTIYCGTVLKDGRTWGANKTDVTVAALIAVAEHAVAFGAPILITHKDGTPAFEITVKAAPIVKD
ncbi:MAG: hypothetical protein ABFE02_01895 [Sulfuricella sp.]